MTQVPGVEPDPWDRRDNAAPDRRREAADAEPPQKVTRALTPIVRGGLVK